MTEKTGPAWVFDEKFTHHTKKKGPRQDLRNETVISSRTSYPTNHSGGKGKERRQKKRVHYVSRRETWSKKNMIRDELKELREAASRSDLG